MPINTIQQSSEASSSLMISSSKSRGTGDASVPRSEQPPGNSGAVKRGLPANRLTECISCGAQGLKCEGMRPTCAQCQRVGRRCSYDWVLDDNVYDLFGRAGNLNRDVHINLIDYYSDKGTFSRIYQTRTLTSGTLVAVKVLCDNVPSQPKVLMLTLRESLAWKSLQHPNIVPLLGIVDYAKICRQGLPQLCLVLPWMSAGNIMEYLEQRPNANVVPLLRDIIDGLLYLHQRLPTPFVHGDLKGCNILIDDSKGRATARLTDMGMQTVWEDTADHEVIPLGHAPGRFENARWMAIERLVPDQYGLRQAEARSTKSDVFELMRTFYEILTGKTPFAGEYIVRVIAKVAAGTHPVKPTSDRVGEDMWRLMIACWSSDPDERPLLASIRAQLPVAETRKRA